MYKKVKLHLRSLRGTLNTEMCLAIIHDGEEGGGVTGPRVIS